MYEQLYRDKGQHYQWSGKDRDNTLLEFIVSDDTVVLRCVCDGKHTGSSYDRTEGRETVSIDEEVDLGYRWIYVGTEPVNRFENNGVSESLVWI